MNINIKPENQTLRVNGNVFRKQPDQDFLHHSLYVCEETQQMLKVNYSTFFQAWRIEGASHKSFMDGFKPYFIHTEDLSREHTFPDQYMEQYFTPCQEKKVCSMIEDVLVEVFARVKQ